MRHHNATPKSSATNQTWAALVPELVCTDLASSLRFWCDILGFAVRYDRPGFAYLHLGGAEVMLEQAGGHWETAPLDPPLGRGINFQIEVADVKTLHDRVVAADVPLFRPLATQWYRAKDQQFGQTEFLVAAPDGYLLRFMQHIGEKPA
ncbi:VOC family protein [Loktanella sp. SALINAS62]|uniref:bleomycin resistance protein n=1 Tax=Loktanella sp. SALINAS62 TaxID=2706124 RepID=UPI001B8BF61B|nr:VOC family protein [Loktanella sp. SALINAS62]MBS1303152.1 VOC family protein [Loktanella sp. SALINAS62]